MSKRSRVHAVAIVCSSLLAGRVAAQDNGDAGARALPRGVVVESVPCAGAAGQSYALYLPSAYAADHAWPILYAFDPGGQGARPVRLAVEAAERFGWIVAGSNNSRNGPTPEIQAAVKALVGDAASRFAIDPRRVYAAGFSGGARVATGLAIGCHGCVAGVFAQGAGLPVGAASGAAAIAFAWFAAAGERDMNYAELFELEQELQKRGATERLRSFEGGHEWAPAAVWSEAFEWFELVAMKDGRRPRDTALAASLFEQASARAAAFETRAEVLDEQRELAAIARDYDGLADTASARQKLAQLVTSQAYKKALDHERSLIEEQAHVTAELRRELAQLTQAPSDEHAQVVLRATQDANELRRRLASAKEPGRRLVYERALAQVYIEAMETARSALRQGQTDSALGLFEIAAMLRPEAPPPQLGRAQAQALAGRRQEAVKALRRAVELGLAPTELAKLLESNDAFAKLRDDPEVRALVATSGRP